MATPDTSMLPTTLDPAATAARAREEQGVVVRWWQVAGFVEVRGLDAVAMLDGICTQSVAAIAPGTARLGCFLDGRARIIAACLLHRTVDVDGEQHLLLATTRDRVEVLARHLTRYRLRSRATIEAVDLATIGVVGCGADRVAAVRGPGWFDDPTWGLPARTFVGSHDEAGELVRDVLPADGVELADSGALEALRIDAGQPSLHDFLVDRMPGEVGAMPDAVSLEKGCYLGQEPVARMHYRGRANRTLRRVELLTAVPSTIRATADEASEAAAAADLVIDASLLEPCALELASDVGGRRAAGTLTTWARRADGSQTGFAVVRREHGAGDCLRMIHAPEVLVTVVDAADDLTGAEHH